MDVEKSAGNIEEVIAKARMRVLEYRDKMKVNIEENVIGVRERAWYTIPAEQVDKLGNIWQHKSTMV